MNYVDDLKAVTGSINPLMVILLIGVALVGSVVMITLCTGGLTAVKKLWDRITNGKNE